MGHLPRWLLSVFEKLERTAARGCARTHKDPRKGDKVEVLRRAFIHPGVLHTIPLNKLSHPCCLLSKYWSRRDISPGAGAQAGDLHCRQSGLKWINSDALVTPRRDYQMKRQEQTPYCFSSPLSHSYWILLPEAERGIMELWNMVTGCCSKGLPLQPCMHLSCGYSRGLTGPLEGKKWGRMLQGVNRGIVSYGPLIKGRIRWESKYACALESINHHLN